MTNQERKSQLQSRQHELQVLMESLDYINHKIEDARVLHGETAAQEVADEYRPKLQQRESWRAEYNANEAEIAELEQAIQNEPAPELPATILAELLL